MAKITVSAVLLYLIYYFIDLKEITSQIRKADLVLILSAPVSYIISIIFGNLSWILIVRSENRHVRTFDLVSCYCQGLFFNNVLPTSFGGDVVKGYSIINKYQQKSYFISSILLDRMINFFMLEMIGAAAFIIYFEKYTLLIVLAGVLALGFIIFTLLNRSLVFFILTTLRRRRRYKWLYIFAVPMLILKNISKQKLRAFSVLLSAFFSQFFKISISVLVGAALGFSLRPAIYCVVPVTSFFAMLPVSINGIGVRESASWLFHEFGGLDAQQYITITVIGFFILTVINCFGIIFFILDRKK
ncbi:MAG TPA: lysylphosphatidylglycerol synthase transmembrane domain-containing protein [Spirochaetota bacterium]|nr:lysylphosphatidylglycerol synthase transmembrane domain-containing protein [Spirochaetota bacterium]